ncbi:MAG TPA: hypothetical protein PLK90_05835 [Clostridiales bacterium]|nr:hypothetical protein [Clostridiales bacterium]HQP69904.1 hypothetical protein [Clostridiales bacterium]
MKKISSVFIIIFVVLLLGETLFEVKDSSNNKVLDVSTDGLRVLNGTDTLMVISTDGIRAYIQKDTKGLSRSFCISTASSKDGDTKAQNKVFEIAKDEGATFYNPSNSTDKIFSIHKNSITANVNQSLGREFLVNDDVISKSNSNLMKVSSKATADAISDSTMLWYKEKNAFRVGHVYITTGGTNVGQASFASGYKCEATGKYSTALGYKSKATASNAFASGNNSIASQTNSFAIGTGTEASGSGSLAAGNSSIASGLNSSAIGGFCKAQNTYTQALGVYATASGYGSRSMGLFSQSTGDYSTSIGSSTISSGMYSMALGNMVTSQAYNSFVVGRWNIVGGLATGWQDMDPLFVVGNGSSDTDRSNAFTVSKDGHVGVGGGTSPSYKLYVEDDYYGIRSYVSTSSGTYTYGVYGRGYGGSNTNYGIYGVAGGGTTNWAGYFSGNINVTGNIVKTSDEVKIDHPIDPENKYLSHTGVISDQMTTVYNGNVVLDTDGKARVKLPEWFESFNGDFKYQLTAIGAPGPNLYIARKVSGNSFDISGGSASMEVSWMITAVRKDNYAKANPVRNEEEKKYEEKGYYLHPEVYGLSAEKGIDYKNEKQMEEGLDKSNK